MARHQQACQVREEMISAANQGTGEEQPINPEILQ